MNRLNCPLNIVKVHARQGRAGSLACLPMMVQLSVNEYDFISIILRLLGKKKKP